MGSTSGEWATIKTYGGSPKQPVGLFFSRTQKNNIWTPSVAETQLKVNPLLMCMPRLKKYPRAAEPFWSKGGSKPTGPGYVRQYDLISRLPSTCFSTSNVSDVTVKKWDVYVKYGAKSEVKSLSDWVTESKIWNVSENNSLFDDDTVLLVAYARFAAFGPIRKSNEILNEKAWFKAANTHPTSGGVMNFENFKYVWNPFSNFEFYDKYGFEFCDGFIYPKDHTTAPLSFGIGHHKYVVFV